MRFDAVAIAAATGGRVLRPAEAGAVVTDSRGQVEGRWFVALRGPRFDGHAYVQAALDAGAVGVIVDDATSAGVTGGAVLVDDTTRALQALGTLARRRFTGPVVGLTGSSGKTTTRALVALALSPLGPVHQTVANLNNHLGVPLTLCAVEPEHRAMVVEMGTSGPGEIEVVARIGEPDIRLIINIGPAHLEELGGLEGVAVEKGALFRTARPGDTAVVNTADPRVAAIELPAGVRRVEVCGEGGSVRVAGIEPRRGGLAMHVRFDTPEGPLAVEIPAFGAHVAADAALAIGVAWVVGVPLPAAVAALADYRPVGMRMQTVELADGVRVFNDAYNANPASMRASLDALGALPGRKAAVLGDMFELGTHEDAMHRQVVAHACQVGLDALVLVGERMARASTAAAQAEELAVHVAPTPAAAATWLRRWLAPGDQVLLKGSRGARVEGVLSALQENT